MHFFPKKDPFLPVFCSRMCTQIYLSGQFLKKHPFFSKIYVLRPLNAKRALCVLSKKRPLFTCFFVHACVHQYTRVAPLGLILKPYVMQHIKRVHFAGEIKIKFNISSFRAFSKLERRHKTSDQYPINGVV